MKHLMLLAFLFVSGLVQAQTITDVNIKSTETGKGKLKKAPKKIFIAEFRVMYQLLYVAEETKEGSVFTSGLTGSAKVMLALGLQGLTEDDLIQNTNRIYKNFTDQITAAGFELVSPDAMAGIKEFKGWERKKGGQLSDVQFKGFIMSTPSNFEYFIKGTKEDGREKKTFTDNSAKISFQGENVTVVKINLVVPMAENGESWASGAFKLGGAKVVGETHLKLSDEMVTGKGLSNSVFTGASYINSEAMSLPTSMMVYNLKDPVTINGVIETKKYRVEATRDFDWSGRQSGIYRVYAVDNRFLKKVVPLPVDPAKYNEGVVTACNAFLKKTWDSFLSNAK